MDMPIARNDIIKAQNSKDFSIIKQLFVDLRFQKINSIFIGIGGFIII